MEISGYLYNSDLEAGVVIVEDNKKSINLNDTLLRSEYLGKKVKIIVEESK